MTTDKKNYFLILFFSIYIFFGIFIYRDFGIGIEEHFQRLNGFYWLDYLLSFSDFSTFKESVNIKYKNILSTNPNLPNIVFFNFYGVIFDVPAAFLETIFNLENSKSYFEIRHFLNFLIFLVSAFFFYKILLKRFNFSIAFFGLNIYSFTPRIFGDSFYNNKDILFLSLLTIAISFLFNFFDKQNNKNLILFCFFSALATSTRIMGIYLPIFLIFFIFLEFLTNKKNILDFLNLSFKIIFFYTLSLYLHYPYIWQLNIFEISDWFNKFFYSMNLKILFNGHYYYMNYLPRSYLPIWIFISTPFILSILFIIGFFLFLKRFFYRLISIHNFKPLGSDLWMSNNEKKDIFILFSFFSFLTYAIFFNVAMLSGWRHFYFLHIFFTYISIFGFFNLVIYFKKNISLKILYSLTILLIIFLIYENVKFHPYQSLYFNNLMSKERIKNFQVDTPSLSRVDALKSILIDSRNKKHIFIANASWTPFMNGKDLLEPESKKKLVFTGQNFMNADYIYDNFIYKSDEKYNKGNMIPINFTIFKKLVINNVHIYSIYKKKNK